MGHPERIFRWSDFANWREEILVLLGDVMDQEVMERFRANPPEHRQASNLEWLHITTANGSRVYGPYLKRTLAARLNSRYTSVRAFHGCRPRDVSSYLHKGLLPFDSHCFAREARAHFVRYMGDAGVVAEGAADLEKELDRILSQAAYSYKDGEVHFCVDSRYLTDVGMPYLTYGSLSMLAVAFQLTRATGIDFKTKLRQDGKATLLVCDVPLRMISQETRECLGEAIIQEIFEDLLAEDVLTPPRQPRLTQLCFAIKEHLPRQCIADYYHPQHVAEPKFSRRSQTR